MAQVNLGQVVPNISVTEVSNGKKIIFTTTTQTVDTTIVDGTDGISPVVEMSTTGDTLTVSVTDVEGTKTKTVAKGTTVYYTDTEPGAGTEVGSVWIG